MPRQPEALIDFEVYENNVNFIGISQATLPAINFLSQQITGAGIAGNVNAVLHGMVDAMTLTLNFRSATDAAVSLLEPRAHNIDLRVAEQYWDTVNSQRAILADKYVFVILPQNYTPGTIAPAALSDASGEYTVNYYAGYKRGKLLWEIDPFNYKCTINGIDYMAEVRRALGR